MPKKPHAPHVLQIRKNMKEVDRLMDIHLKISGSGPGRKQNVQVINKSAIILLLACWEAYVEDLAENAFKHMLKTATSPKIFPDHVLALAAKQVTKLGPERIWELADVGWKISLENHKDKILEKYIIKGSFNTPSAQNIDRLYAELIGLTSASKQWYWPGMSRVNTKDKLQDLIELRGQIAHRVESSKPVYKKDIVEYKNFIGRLGAILHNRTMKFINKQTGTTPWREYTHGKTS